MKKIDKLPAEFYQETRKRFFTQIEDYSAVVFFAGEAPRASGDNMYTFAPNRNFLYMTGIDAPKVIYLAFKLPNKIEETVFVERSDKLLEKWVGKALSADEAKDSSGIEKAMLIDEFEGFLASALSARNIKNLYLDLENIDGKLERREPLAFYERFRKNYPAIRLSDGGKIVEKMRGIKADAEIERIKRAIYFTSLAFEHIINSISPGMYEYQIESCFDFALKFNGIKERAFTSIIAGGKNACVLHYCSNDAIVKDGDLILFDFGATCGYYAADISRTIPINGKFTERQKELYNIVLEGQTLVLEAVKPGVTILELNEILINHYKKALKRAGIIYKRARGSVLAGLIEKFYWHKVGHSLGLDVHDCAPKRDVPLEPGMVITVEPGLYLEREGIGIRIEDDILVTESGYINLSEGIPKTVEEIELAFERKRGER